MKVKREANLQYKYTFKFRYLFDLDCTQELKPSLQQYNDHAGKFQHKMMGNSDVHPDLSKGLRNTLL